MTTPTPSPTPRTRNQSNAICAGGTDWHASGRMMKEWAEQLEIESAMFKQERDLARAQLAVAIEALKEISVARSGCAYPAQRVLDKIQEMKGANE